MYNFVFTDKSGPASAIVVRIEDESRSYSAVKAEGKFEEDDDDGYDNVWIEHAQICNAWQLLGAWNSGDEPRRLNFPL